VPLRWIFVVKTFDATPKSGQDTIALLTVEPTALNVNVISGTFFQIRPVKVNEADDKAPLPAILLF
jgi:hypothetical protein